ncbi:MAG: SAM-dependent methyltransferase [Chloroflexota bacterium]
MTHVILSCSPYFVDLAVNEVRRYHPETTVSTILAPGYVLLKSPCSFGEFTAPWKQLTPIYLHHLFPVHASLTLNKTLDDLDMLKAAVQRISPPDASVQVRSAIETEPPFSIADIQHCLNGNRNGQDITTPSGRIVSVLLTPDFDGIRAHLGISWATQNLSPWAGGQIPVTEPVSNRAGYKLLEALRTFAIRLHEGDCALDLGAAPGAWTTLLRRRGLRVTAVAPAALYPWLTLDQEVVHEPIRAEDYLARCQTTFDLIVNDMMLDPQDSARLMVEYAAHLRSEGIAIMTLKLREHNRSKRMDHSLRLLRKAYKIIQIRQLVSNKQEVTLFLRRNA